MSNSGTSLAFVVVVLFLGLLSFNFDLMDAGEYFLAQVGSSIGVHASVPPNPFNTLAQQLKDKEDELNLREKGINEKEKILNEEGRNMPSLEFMFATVGALSLLMLTHLYFDYKKNKQSGIV